MTQQEELAGAVPKFLTKLEPVLKEGWGKVICLVADHRVVRWTKEVTEEERKAKG